MRAYLPAYEMVVPRTLDEALALLREEPGVWRPFAGGTDLMVLLEAEQSRYSALLDGLHLAAGVEEELRSGARAIDDIRFASPSF